MLGCCEAGGQYPFVSRINIPESINTMVSLLAGSHDGLSISMSGSTSGAELYDSILLKAMLVAEEIPSNALCALLEILLESMTFSSEAWLMILRPTCRARLQLCSNIIAAEQCKSARLYGRSLIIELACECLPSHANPC